MAFSTRNLCSIEGIPEDGTLTNSSDETRLHRNLKASDGRDIESLWKLGVFYSRTEFLDQAKNCFLRVIELTADTEHHAASLLALGQIQEKKHDYQVAAEYYRVGIDLKPHTPHTAYYLRNNLGYCLIQKRDYEAAVPFLDEALRIDPARANAFKNPALAVQGSGNYVEAAKLFVTAIRRNPADSRSLFHLNALVKQKPFLLEKLPDLWGFLNQLQNRIIDVHQTHSTKGYVYILEVRDLVLPVCKIGFTARNVKDRCAEINTGGTGDFIWEVAYKVFVNDCRNLERLVHEELEPLRQKRREFFNIRGDIAYNAMISIIESQTELKEISEETAGAPSPSVGEPKKKKRRDPRKIDPQYAELLHSFLSLRKTKGEYFGQTNKPIFGVSDGNRGVQWNIAVHTDTGLVRVGVNLEGLKYDNWPIASFILSELENPSITAVQVKLEHPDQVYLRFVRDAWQVTSRPDIVERYFGEEDQAISKVDLRLWSDMLEEALGCLDKEKGYRGRNKQMVTYLDPPKRGERIREMPVSPHLNIWTPINKGGDIDANMRAAFCRVEPIHKWVSRLAQ